MDKAQIAGALDEIASLLELLGENPFKVRAHRNAARAVETLAGDLAALIANKNLTDVRGIGAHIAAKIETLFTTGALPELDQLRARVPRGVLEMLTLPGLGPKRVKIIWDKLGAATLGELAYACNENRLVALEGFGAKTQEKILKGIETHKAYIAKFLYPQAREAAEALLERIKKSGAAPRAQIAGSTRRGKEVIGDIDLLAASTKPEKVMDSFVTAPGVAEILSRGATKSSIRLDSGMQADLRVVTPDEYPYALLYFTGGKEHNTAMRQRAKERGLKLNEYGLFKSAARIPCESEEDVFRALGLAFIPPELRENTGEIELAARGPLPRLVELSDLKGIFHCHSNYSDGVESIETMAREAMARGYTYLGISDHSRSAHYAGGLDVDRLKRQGEEIDRLNAKLKGITIFKGVESDILPDGSLDYPPKVLESLDFVVASVHSAFWNDRARMTERIIKAVENPCATMLGHPTGRLLLAREGYPVDMARIIEACAKHGVIMELNANPHRLDIDWREIGAAKAAGVKIAISPDAHRIPGLDHVAYGVMIARKGGLLKEDIFNTMPVKDVAAELKTRRSRKG